MAKIRIGSQHDDSTSQNDLSLRPESNLEVEIGDQHERSKRLLRVSETDPTTGAAQPRVSGQAAGGEGPATALWARGSFFLVAFGTAAAVIGILAKNLSWYLVPVSIVGAIIVLYLLATVLVPHGPLTEKGLLSVLRAYVHLAFTFNAKAKGAAESENGKNRK